MWSWNLTNFQFQRGNKINAKSYLKCQTSDYWMYWAWFPSEIKDATRLVKPDLEITGFAGSVKLLCGMPAIAHTAAFLCYFLDKNSALRFFIHLLENSLMINNMLIRVYKKMSYFFYLIFYILEVSVLWIKYTKLYNLVKIEEQTDLKSSLYL